MSWWSSLWLCVIAAMFSVWIIGPPFSNAGLILWYIYDSFPMVRPWLPYTIKIQIRKV